jgi:hypothetical protein
MIPIEPIIPITSREYKMMLKAERFVGDGNAVDTALERFRDAVRDTTELEVRGDFEFDKKQEVRFWDLPDHWLYNEQNYVLRTRNRNDKASLTLKCRHGDRYFVQSRVVIAEDAKFEEDLKPRFTHLFSYSRKAEADAPKDVDVLIDLFPDLKNRIGQPLAGSRFELVRNFVAIERVYSGLKVELSESFDAECAVVVWYDLSEGDDETPVVAEFSFRYPRNKWRKKPPAEPHNAFDGFTGLVAHDFYTALQDSKALKENWLDPESKTKTRFAYEG